MRKADYTEADLKRALTELGVKKGDNIFMHSNIGFFGRMENANSADALCESYISSLKEAVGTEGTIVLPTFSYSFCHGEIYNPATTKSDCGMLTTYSYEKSDFVRSLDPNFSIAAWGKNAKLYTENPMPQSFGRNSFWERWLNTGGKLVCMNFDCGSTFIHFAERFFSVPYRYNKAFNGVIEVDGNPPFRNYAVHYVNDGGMDAPCMARLDKKCRQYGICKTANLGKGTMLAIDIRDYFELIKETLKSEPLFLTVGGQG